MAITVGIDTGGTFTDLVAVDDESGRWHVAKVPSNPANPVAAIEASLEAAGFDPAAVSFVVVGTTIGINAVLTRRGARVVYLTTEGFQDVPHIQRINRKYHYDFHWRKPTPLVHRPDCLGVPERLDEEGRVLEAIDLEALASALGEIVAAGGEVPAIAVCFLFSYLNAEHELAARAMIAERFPQLAVSLSHEVAPIWREYERGTTVTVDAYLKPLFERYVDGVSSALEAKGTGGHLGVAQVERRPRARRRGARAPGAPAALGHRRRRHRRRLRGARGRRTAGDRARHGRDELRRVPDRRRRAALLLGLRDRVRPARERAERLDAHDRRRRRLDRLGRPRRLPAGRPAERGRRSRACLLRPGRRGRDDHRRRRRAGPARPGVLPRRPHRARSRARRAACSARSASGSGSTASRRPRRWCASATRTWRTRSASSPSSRASIRASSRSSRSAAPARRTPARSPTRSA